MISHKSIERLFPVDSSALDILLQNSAQPMYYPRNPITYILRIIPLDGWICVEREKDEKGARDYITNMSSD